MSRLTDIEAKLDCEIKDVKEKYFQTNLNYLYSIDDTILEMIDDINTICNTNEVPTFNITYDGKKDIVYVWFDKEDELIIALIKRKLILFNYLFYNINTADDVISMDYINDKVIIEIKYNNQRVIDNNMKYKLYYNEI